LSYPFVLSWSCLEATSAARVVASNTGPVREVIEHGVNGLLFDFFDVPALSRQVVEVLSKPGNYADVGVRARDLVVHRYDLKRACLAEQVKLISGK
jgi:glycosyltransferase involved in cell wall biosynthesis